MRNTKKQHRTNKRWEKRSSGEKYSWFFLDLSSAWAVSFVFTLTVITFSIALFALYGSLNNDPTPDSIAGYAYAIVGSLFLLLAAVGYTHRRRSRKRSIGQLNGSLHWHISFGMIAIVLLFLHSFGNFNPRSGTYALYGMIAVVISGIIGRVLDRVVPKLIAYEVKHALTERGEDRSELHTRTIESIASYKMTAWDLAYISLEETPQELGQNEIRDYFVPDRQSKRARREALTPDVGKHLKELHSVQSALQREEYYRALLRYWRFGHVALVVITFGLVVWHLEYAASLLIPTFFK